MRLFDHRCFFLLALYIFLLRLIICIILRIFILDTFQVYTAAGTTTDDQGDELWSIIRSKVRAARNAMRDGSLFWAPSYDMSWTDMIAYVYNGTANTYNGQNSTTPAQLFAIPKFNYQLNTGLVGIFISLNDDDVPIYIYIWSHVGQLSRFCFR